MNYLIIFFWMSLAAWNLFHFKGNFSFGKSQKTQGTNLGCREAESPGWFGVSPKNSAWDVMHAWVGVLLWWSCQSPVAHSYSLLNPSNSFHGEIFKFNTIFDADLLLYFLSHFEGSGHTVHCSLNGIYHPHWLVQWSCHCSHKHIPVHSPWLPSYTDVVQTVLVTLTMAGLFPDGPCIHIKLIRNGEQIGYQRQEV